MFWGEELTIRMLFHVWGDELAIRMLFYVLGERAGNCICRALDRVIAHASNTFQIQHAKGFGLLAFQV